MKRIDLPDTLDEGGPPAAGSAGRGGPGGLLFVGPVGVALFFVEPVPPGTLVDLVTSDSQECCVDASFAAQSCANPIAVTSFRLMTLRVH